VASPIIQAIPKIAGAVAVLVLVAVLYGTYAEGRAKRRAEAFCQSVHIGDSTAGLLERAKLEGADMRQSLWAKAAQNQRTLDVTFVGIPPLPRQICRVTGEATVTNARYLSPD
jgi:hypothetical protein